MKRKVIDYYRKQAVRKDTSDQAFLSPFREEGLYEGHWTNERGPNPWTKNADDDLNDEEFMAVLNQCLTLLPENWRAVFVLKFMEEMESTDIFKELGCSASNLWVIVHRARLKLRECVEKGWLN